MLSHFLYILYIGWCYYQDTVADLIAIVVADVIATMMWWIFLPLSILCNDSITLADVIANFYLWQILLPSILCLMLLPLIFFGIISLYCKVADVVAIICGRWKTTICLYVMLADVIAMVVDQTTTQGGFLFGRCYSHGGRWNYNWSTSFQF